MVAALALMFLTLPFLTLAVAYHALIKIRQRETRNPSADEILFWDYAQVCSQYGSCFLSLSFSLKHLSFNQMPLVIRLPLSAGSKDIGGRLTPLVFAIRNSIHASSHHPEHFLSSAIHLLLVLASIIRKTAFPTTFVA